MKKVSKSLIHNIVTFLNAVTEDNHISVSISFSLRYKHVDVFTRYFVNDNLVNTTHYAVTNNNFIDFKNALIGWVDKMEEKYGTKS